VSASTPSLAGTWSAAYVPQDDGLREGWCDRCGVRGLYRFVWPQGPRAPRCRACQDHHGDPPRLNGTRL
jgi:hypothetical protein